MQINEVDINQAFEKIKRLANGKFLKQEYGSSLAHIESAAIHAYNFNIVYTDPDLEEMIEKISSKLFEQVSNRSNTGRILFYDSFGWENRGLTQQYIRALIKLGYSFLYVFENKHSKYSATIEAELRAFPSQVEVFEMDIEMPLIARGQDLYQRILEYNPDKGLLHLSPGCSMALSVFHAFPNIEWININLTDHAFWLGSKLFHKNIEFRDYGYSISLRKRFFKHEQLARLPYYPIMEPSPFEGFPERAMLKDKVIVFSGGSFYKVYGDNGLFFTILDQLLVENPEIVLLFAGSGDPAVFKMFIDAKGYQERVLLLGHRKDINELFTKCDIYLGTYPLSGGLMSQYAAVNGKPILAYTSDDLPANYVEEVVCHNRNFKITYTDLREFFDYAKRLVRDPQFREGEGSKLRQVVISPEQFAEELDEILKYSESHRRMKEIRINYERFSQLYLEIENQFTNAAKNYLISRYRLRAIILFPKFSILCVKNQIRKRTCILRNSFLLRNKKWV
ncbi:hypothetical protein B0I27_103138 [Arcticibacter pallidicorallinus]|uniref:Glycosyltransferase involved in cell wall biosynthesis n=1 Tax=Arcticibacter pallidicorallinus TaxID=1259464 RepID=A0A2T0U728_9SPHI|nr:glycosyltransferase [Arcticibacter pallidicorallinus]PRY53668.1 hypothetical protein B0I27_103138 [Arcticibacter pallidicorallinus]